MYMLLHTLITIYSLHASFTAIAEHLILKEGIFMKTLILSAAAFMLVGALPCAVHAAPPSATYSHAQLQAMMREAHTQQQFQVLATYFRARQQHFKEQAAAEMVEWDRRSQNVVGPAEKYPRPVDSSRNRYEYFSHEAAQMGQQAARYELMAAGQQERASH
jgi:hypothetical protein